MSMRVAVVGGGIIGCACAFELARRGADVTVFDMRHPGGGATQASAGILAPYVEGHANEALLDLGIRGLDVYDEFVQFIVLCTTLPSTTARTNFSFLIARIEGQREEGPGYPSGGADTQ